MPPTVTVLLPVYNGGRFLAQALDSVLAQTWADWELVAVNDGSTDTSADLLARYAQRDQRVHVFSQENAGVVAALNRGLEFAGGRYLARLDADDELYPERLARQVALLERQPQMVICGSGCDLVDEQNRRLATIDKPQSNTDIQWRVLFHNPFANSGVMFRLDALRKAGLRYEGASGLAEDYALWSRLLRLGQGYNFKEPLFAYRVHPEQASQTRQAELEACSNEVSRANLLYLGVSLSIEQVAVLRDWTLKFPARLGPENAPEGEALLEILRRFAAQPQLESSPLRLIRGRWLAKLLAAFGPGAFRRAWLQRLQPGDVGALAWYAGWRGWLVVSIWLGGKP